jgi:hypothetical protein
MQAELVSANETFNKLMLPKLLEYFDSFRSTELHENEADVDADLNHSIDGYLYKNGVEYSVAIRGQFRGGCEKTYTIKDSREGNTAVGYWKLKSLIDNHESYPDLFLQFYTDAERDNLLCFGIVDTTSLVDEITKFLEANTFHHSIRLAHNTVAEAHSDLFSIDMGYMERKYPTVYWQHEQLERLLRQRDILIRQKVAQRYKEMSNGLG